MAQKTYEDWVSVYSTGTDYEADLIRDRLDDAGISAVVLSQRDHAFNLNLGDLAKVHVMVQSTQEVAAQKILATPIVSDEELDEAAMAGDASIDDNPVNEGQTLFDSGAEKIHLKTPPEDA